MCLTINKISDILCNRKGHDDFAPYVKHKRHKTSKSGDPKDVWIKARSPLIIESMIKKKKQSHKPIM